MDVFVRRVPVQTTESALKSFFEPILQQFSISVFNCKKIKNKSCAILTVADSAKAELFLKRYGQAESVVGCEPLIFINTSLKVSVSKYSPDELTLRALRYEESELQRKASQKTPKNDNKRAKLQRAFDFSDLRCGIWDYSGSQIAFASHFQDSRRGNAMFGRRTLAMVLRSDDYLAPAHRIDISYWGVDTIVTRPQSKTVTFTLKFAPRIYKLEDGLEKLMSSLNINGPNYRQQNSIRKRVSAINNAHELIVGSCFIYQITLSSSADVSKLDQLLHKDRGMPPALGLPISSTPAQVTLKQDFEYLRELLYTGRQYGGLDFSTKFQVERLARNVYLPPSKIVTLLPVIKQLSGSVGYIPTTMAVRLLSRHIQYPGPHLGPETFDTSSLARKLIQYAQNFKLDGSMYDIKSRHSHIALIHKAIITPVGTYLEGPDPEVSNRVLRQYADHTDHFLRVQFTDEDGDAVRFEPRTSLSEIFNSRFKDVLGSTINIGGHNFEFLGFSHSSLRAQTCWFMSPFVQDRYVVAAQKVIEGLGDFSGIRSPAKCAARIGQAFSNTTSTVTVPPETVRAAYDVIRNGHTFSDGVGTISYELLERVLRQYDQARNQRPTCLQIRFAGAKGVVSLDNRLRGEQLILRESMVKFNGSKTRDIEICGANFKPLPMYLNRQFIKILEDLGVPPQIFLELQDNMVEQLRRITQSPVNAATFLELARVGLATKTPYLLRILYELDLSLDEDTFLSQVVEMAALSQLRNIKHRSRIHVEQGVTLYGIMDETGFLEEGQVYCVIERSGKNGRPRRTVLLDEVIVTRSPAMHPGDIQKARAVDVPEASPLRALANVIVFSQKGQRDLPSQLSGGDLDGDLYNIIFDRRLMPGTTHLAAEYKKSPAQDIGRPVVRQDITDFFVKFMETDQLGRISTVHMQLADRRPKGTFDPDCIKLAEMASTAVDFSKSGVPVDMAEFPRYDTIRPDFMASNPRVIVKERGVVFPEDEDDSADQDDIVGTLAPDFKAFRYYESDRVLGQLYRAIDEKEVFQEIQRHAQRTENTLEDRNVIGKIWAYVTRETALIQWEEYKSLAMEVREIYESNLLDVMFDYSPHSHYPLSEAEVFSGNIIGKNGGTLNRRVRERTVEMNERFERDISFAIRRITQGDDGVRDEALARSIACLAIGMMEQRRPNKRVGPLRSWKYIAAAVCLREIELFKIRFDPLNII